MPHVVFRQLDGTERRVEAAPGANVMVTALRHGVGGIEGECGGSAMCATCHVYVDEDWLAKLGEIGPVEDELLDATASERHPTSRLGCQIVLTPELDGLAVTLPPSQA